MNQDRHENKTFENVNYTLQEVNHKEFEKCLFRNCDFTKNAFYNCKFIDCVFEFCDLSLIRIGGSYFSHVSFRGCRMVGIYWDEAYTPLRIDFKECILNYSSFLGRSLKDVKIIACQATEVDFSNGNFEKAIFHGTDFSGSNFKNTNLQFSDFTDARNYIINPGLNKVKKAIFVMPEALGLLRAFDIDLR
jgi:fluoroquinolone resistance protein